MSLIYRATILALSGFLFLFVIIPLLGVVARVGSLNVLEALKRPELLSSITLSLETATVSTTICALTGIPLGYVMSRTAPKLSALLRIVMAIPLTIPPLIDGALLLNVYGAASLFGRAGFVLTQNPVGIVLAQTFVASPFVVLTAASAFERLDPNYEYVSRTLGKGPGQTFLKVTLPLTKTGIAPGIVLAWVRSLGEFGATVMMAYNPKTVSIQLWEDNAIGGMAMMLPGVFLVLIVSCSALGLWFWLSGLQNPRKHWLI
ncbi:MAG: ABC transporter permease subunit [Candidatus Bathyarchaeia archaeon]|jgi:molybdate/tungstate transport system permease protein